MTSTRHEPVYHATHGCQAASLSLTATRWRGLKRACQVERQKNAGFLSSVEGDQHTLQALRGFACMLLLRLLKGGALICLLLGPDGKHNAHPDIGQSTHGDGVAFALSSFPLVIGFGPGLRACTVKSKLVQGIAQGLDTAHPPMSFGIGATLEENRRGSGQGLQAGCRLVAAAILADFGKQTRSQTCSSAGQAWNRSWSSEVKKRRSISSS